MTLVPRITCNMFFDAPAVEVALRRRDARYLARSGAWIRRVAQRSVRRRKNPDLHSPAGSPPFDHRGVYRKLILFGVDVFRQSVVIGFFPFPNSDVPELHEFGGTKSIDVEIDAPPKRRRRRTSKSKTSIREEQRRTGRRRKKRRTRRVRATYPARPTMSPALELGASKLPEFWAKETATAARAA